MLGEFDLAQMEQAARSDLDAVTLEPAKTALIIVDMQYYSACRTTGMGKKFTEAGHVDHIARRFDWIEQRVIPNLQKLLTFFRENKLKVVYLTLGSQTSDLSDVPFYMKAPLQVNNGRVGTLESCILEEIQPVEGETVIHKSTSGAFASSPLDFHLRCYGIEHLLLTGVATSGCVGLTAYGAADLGYHCVAVEDACGDTLQEDHEWFLRHFRCRFGRVASTDDVITELAHAPMLAVKSP